MLKQYLVGAFALVASAAPAAAVNQAVKDACKPDYHAYCDGLRVESQEPRACMKDNALKLSKGCLQALVDNKEVTKADIDDYLARSKKAVE